MESRLGLASALIARNLSASLRTPQQPTLLNKVASKKTVFESQQLLFNVAVEPFPALNSLKFNFVGPAVFSAPGGQNNYNYLYILSAVALTGTLATAYASSVNKTEKRSIQTPLLGFETVLSDNANSSEVFNINTYDFGAESKLSELSTVNFPSLFSGSPISVVDNRRMNFSNSEYFVLQDISPFSSILNDTDLHKEIWKSVENFSIFLFHQKLQDDYARDLLESTPSNLYHNIQENTSIISHIETLTHLATSTILSLLSFVPSFITTSSSPSIVTEISFLSQYLAYCLEADAPLDLPLLFPNEIVYNSSGAIVGSTRSFTIPMMRSTVKKAATLMVRWKLIARNVWIALFEVPPSVSRVEEVTEVEPSVLWNKIETEGLMMMKEIKTTLPEKITKSVIRSPVLLPNSLFAELEAAKSRDLLLSEPENKDTVISETVDSTYSGITMTKQDSVLALSDFKKLKMDEDMKNMSGYEEDEWLKVKMRGIGVPVEVLWEEFWNSGRARGNEIVVDEVLGEELW
ncbi:hypothetical protein HK096_001992 [Nowakowskiella sp. JEL0078]|nr:hypothetical protein HK096_001992 [Nowakowskiella sp. JEL0078]